jgi:hypothetical protein
MQTVTIEFLDDNDYVISQNVLKQKDGGKFDADFFLNQKKSILLQVNTIALLSAKAVDVNPKQQSTVCLFVEVIFPCQAGKIKCR